ncbi:hypothetical protein [Micromonospora sagamiensis]|uniref:Uncharacterized protein n=1 Tax=Micromonospora sagamiensis TaxID=47875 RepID=A0A562WQ06_9ACTN|nr:hypothetical protein [Micromonospora sagamiensis]TWJ32262.1 hypothetical protein JD81_05837 [Micromonospora sagamiensis]BCL14676.1 hypothetical protein GCM10017556_24150 [Micromonospora sagamiensis]
MKDVVVVLRHLARLDGAAPDMEQICVTTALNTAAVRDFITAGCALVAANVQERLLVEATQVLWNVYDGASGPELVTAGERVRAVGLALTQAQEERERALVRFREACSLLRHDGALFDAVSKPVAPPGGVR